MNDPTRQLTTALKAALAAIEDATDTMHYEDGQPVTALEGWEIERMYISLCSVMVEVSQVLEAVEIQNNPQDDLNQAIVSYDTNMKDTITQAEYRAFQQAYDFFNRELFGASLPPVLVTLQRHAKAYGYFSPERFVGRSDTEEAAHELAMNPDHFGRSDELILSTLAHEMAHVWQRTHGTMPRRGYHDRQWAEKMKAIGLQPSSTGQPGGKETGQSVSHYILPAGAYAKAYARLAATGFKLRWQSRIDAGTERKKKQASKTKFSCPECGQNAWAKPDALLICGDCYEDGEGDINAMIAEVTDSAAAA